MFAHPRPKKSLLLPLAKRRKTVSAIEEIKFDFDARADYLTGFHKRKVQRAKRAQGEAAKKAKEERLATRKQLREERRQELEAHLEAVNLLLKEAKKDGVDTDGSDDETWNGVLDDPSSEPINHEAEYIDEDLYTVVTVEAVDVSKEGLHKVAEGEDTANGHDCSDRETRTDSLELKTGASKKLWPKKTREKKFRYETKAERKVTQGKQRTRNKLKADARRRKG